MSWRAFRLHEMLSRIDEALRAEQHRKVPNPLEITRLKKLKWAIKTSIVALVRRPRKV